MRGSVLLLGLLAGLGAVAQTPDTSTPPPQTATITVQSNLVLVPTLVQDAKGGVIYGLKASQFIVRDNGVRQTVHMEDAAEASALSLVVVVQCSRSADEQQQNLSGLPAMVEAMIGETEQETAVVSFGTSPELLAPFSRSRDRVHDVVQLYKPCEDDGGASIFDAVDYAARLLETRDPHRRRAILLISETRDHGSELKPQAVIARLGRSNIVVDSVAFSPGRTEVVEDLKHSDGANGGLFGLILMAVQALRKNAPKEFARLSGGEYINFATQKGFDRSLNGLANHVHNGYLLSFQPHGDLTPGLHTITVEVPDYKDTVRHRESYWYGDPPAPTDKQPDKQPSK